VEHRWNTADEDLRDDEYQAYQVSGPLAGAHRDPAAHETRQQQQPEGHQAPAQEGDESHGHGDEHAGGRQFQAAIAAPQRLPKQEQAEVGEGQGAGDRAAEIPPNRQMHDHEHQRQDAILMPGLGERVGLRH
jgi:hypothetical protein